MDKGFFLSIEVLKITLFSVGEVFLINVIVMRCSFSKFQETAAKETTPVAESWWLALLWLTFGLRICDVITKPNDVITCTSLAIRCPKRRCNVSIASVLNSDWNACHWIWKSAITNPPSWISCDKLIILCKQCWKPLKGFIAWQQYDPCKNLGIRNVFIDSPYTYVAIFQRN